MRVSVNQALHVVLAHDGFHRLLVHVHDLRFLGGGGIFADFPEVVHDLVALRDGLAEEFLLPRRTPYLGAESHVFGVVGAQRIAMHQQCRCAVEIDVCGVLEQTAAGGFFKAIAHQEVAVAVHHENRRAVLGQLAQPADDGTELLLLDGLVADPVLEQVAEDVERVRGTRAAAEKIEEQPSNGGAGAAEMQVGNEQRGSRHLCPWVS